MSTSRHQNNCGYRPDTIIPHTCTQLQIEQTFHTHIYSLMPPNINPFPERDSLLSVVSLPSEIQYDRTTRPEWQPLNHSDSHFYPVHSARYPFNSHAIRLHPQNSPTKRCGLSIILYLRMCYLYRALTLHFMLLNHTESIRGRRTLKCGNIKSSLNYEVKLTKAIEGSNQMRMQFLECFQDLFSTLFRWTMRNESS